MYNYNIYIYIYIYMCIYTLLILRCKRNETNEIYFETKMRTSNGNRNIIVV